MEATGWLLSALVVAAGGTALWKLRTYQSDDENPFVTTASPSPAATSRPRPENQLPILKFDDLLKRSGTAGLVREIENKLGYTRNSYEADVLPILTSFAEYVQLLPASESHHHAQPGGLLEHLLEVARNALHFRLGMKLPLGSTPEEQAQYEARWTYAVFLAALFHDIGKPISDLHITLYGPDPDNGQVWNAIAGDMAENKATHYSVDFVERRDYGQHARLPIVLLRALVPTHALQWIGEAPGLMDQLVPYLAGENIKSPIADLVMKADRLSVSENLKNGPRTRFASAKTIPLIERLMAALRTMLQEGTHLPLNRPGAAGFFDGQHIWFVAGTVADKTRAFLKDRETRLAGAAGVPDNNSILMDVWMEYGAVVPNEAGSAIWKMRVTIGSWQETLTVLKFPIALLYRDPSQYPQPMGGTIESAASPAASTPAVAQPIQTAAQPIVELEQLPPVIETLEQPRPDYELVPFTTAVPEIPEINAATIAEDSLPGTADIPDISIPPASESEQAWVQTTPPEPPTPTITAQSVVEEIAHDFLAPADSASAVYARSSSPRPAAAPRHIKAPMAVARKGPQPDASGKKPSERAERFVAWIQHGLATGELQYNETSAMVHFVTEGMLLLTPGIIKHYVQQCGLEGDGQGSSSDEDWRKLQHEFQKSGYPEKSGAGSYIHYYTTAKRTQGKPMGVYLIPKPERFLNPVPPPNPYIFSKTKRTDAEEN